MSAAGSHPSITLASGETVKGDLVVGADGVHSAIRRAVHPNEPPPRASGLRALRGVVSGTCHHLGPLGGMLYLGRGLESAAVKAGPDVVYFYVSLRGDLVADVPATRPACSARALRDPGRGVRRRRRARPASKTCAWTISSIATRCPTGARTR